MLERTAPVDENSAKIEEISEDDPLQKDQTPIIAAIELAKDDEDVILCTKSIKTELSSKYSGLKKSVRGELAYLKAFSEQSSPSLRSVIVAIFEPIADNKLSRLSGSFEFYFSPETLTSLRDSLEVCSAEFSEGDFEDQEDQNEISYSSIKFAVSEIMQPFLQTIVNSSNNAEDNCLKTPDYKHVILRIIDLVWYSASLVNHQCRLAYISLISLLWRRTGGGSKASLSTFDSDYYEKIFPHMLDGLNHGFYHLDINKKFEIFEELDVDLKMLLDIYTCEIKNSFMTWSKLRPGFKQPI